MIKNETEIDLIMTKEILQLQDVQQNVHLVWSAPSFSHTANKPDEMSPRQGYSENSSWKYLIISVDNKLTRTYKNPCTHYKGNAPVNLQSQINSKFTHPAAFMSAQNSPPI